jgi:hypothetical protein
MVAFRLTSVRSDDTGSTRRLSSRFVGREDELRVLDHCLGRVLAEQRARLVTEVEGDHDGAPAPPRPERARRGDLLVAPVAEFRDLPTQREQIAGEMHRRVRIDPLVGDVALLDVTERQPRLDARIGR